MIFDFFQSIGKIPVVIRYVNQVSKWSLTKLQQSPSTDIVIARIVILIDIVIVNVIVIDISQALFTILLHGMGMLHRDRLKKTADSPKLCSPYCDE